MKTTKTTSYDIRIDRDGIWAGSGTYDHSESDTVVSGSIRDCGAVIGDEIYAAIEDAITDMDAPADGKIEVDGKTYTWTLTAK